MGIGPIRRKTVQPAAQAHKSFSEAELRKLLEHEAWIRRLAKSLVADESRVNELIQHALTEALKNPPRNPKPWLTVVMRAAAWRMRRSESRRKARENAVARSEMQLPAVPGADQKETRERLVRIVQELEEPYRETLFLHFFEELTLEEIARRKGIPSATMRTRLRRALAQMREKLRSHYGDPSRWVFSLLPVAQIRRLGDLGSTGAAGSGKAHAVASAGAQAAGWKSIAAAAAVVLAGSSTLAFVVSKPGFISERSSLVSERDPSGMPAISEGESGDASFSAVPEMSVPDRNEASSAWQSRPIESRGVASAKGVGEEITDENFLAPPPEEIGLIPVVLKDGSMSGDPKDGAIPIPPGSMKGKAGEIQFHMPFKNQGNGKGSKQGQGGKKKKAESQKP